MVHMSHVVAHLRVGVRLSCSGEEWAVFGVVADMAAAGALPVSHPSATLPRSQDLPGNGSANGSVQGFAGRIKVLSASHFSRSVSLLLWTLSGYRNHTSLFCLPSPLCSLLSSVFCLLSCLFSLLSSLLLMLRSLFALVTSNFASGQQPSSPSISTLCDSIPCPVLQVALYVSHSASSRVTFDMLLRQGVLRH